MHIWATKSPYERAQEEDERLVRRSPKDKPPRRDLRREHVRTEADPDADDASDEKDRSRNYKNIGGSVVLTAAKERVPAKNRETGKTVLVSPETLKEESGKYEPIDGDDESSEVKEPNSEKPEVSGEATDPKPEKLDKTQFYSQAGKALNALAKKNPKLQSKLKGFMTPESDLFGLVKENPQFPAKSMFPGVDLPKGLNTLEDVKQALEHAGAGKPTEKKPKKDPKETPAEAPESQPEAPKTDAPEEPAGEGSGEKKPKKKKAPKAEDPEEGDPEEPEVKPEPTPAEKAGIPAPKRRAVTAMEREEALSLLVDTFSADTVAKLTAGGIHPDDVKTLVRDYTSAKKSANVRGDLSNFAAKVSQFYKDTPDQVEPPLEGANAQGEVVPFDKLTPEEQSEATRKHQLKVAAMSLAARDVLTDKLMDTRSLSGTPRVPKDVAHLVAGAMLKGDSVPEEMGPKVFDHFLKSGRVDKIDEKTAARLMAKVKGSKAAKTAATAYMQANDYGQAKDKFLGGDDESISEWQDPKDIIKGLKRANEYFSGRNRLYGTTDAHPAASFFRMKVLKRLRALDPKKAAAVTRELPELEREEYEQAHSEYERQHKDWTAKQKAHHEALTRWEGDNQHWNEQKQAHEAEQETKKAEYEKAHEGDEEAEPFKPEPFKAKAPKHPGAFTDEEPLEPPKPLGQPDPEEGSSMWKAMFQPSKAKSEAQPEPEVAKEPDIQVDFDDSDFETAAKAAEATEDMWAKKAGDSTYPALLVMGSAGKTGVYHGVDPYAFGSAAYPGWLQPHQRDIGDEDCSLLLSSAERWLESPLLSVAIDGMEPDARYRSALDLAIYEGPYNGQIQPTLYNQLLAKLAGKPEPGRGQTLLTIREASYELSRMDLLVYGKKAFGAEVEAAIRQARFACADGCGQTVEGHVEIRQAQSGELPTKEGFAQESVVSVDLPKGSESAALKAIQSALQPLSFRVEKTASNSKPGLRRLTASDNSIFATGDSMKTSQEIRRFAAQAGNTNSKLAFEMLAFADRLAEDEKKGLPPWLEKFKKDKKDGDEDEGQKKEASNKFASLKSTIIKHAASLDASQRASLLPILQALKALG